jgi:hypothetical protein
VVAASTLGRSRPTDYFLIEKDECGGPFPDEHSALTALQLPRGSFGYGNVAPIWERSSKHDVPALPISLEDRMKLSCT